MLLQFGTVQNHVLVERTDVEQQTQRKTSGPANREQCDHARERGSLTGDLGADPGAADGKGTDDTRHPDHDLLLVAVCVDQRERQQRVQRVHECADVWERPHDHLTLTRDRGRLAVRRKAHRVVLHAARQSRSGVVREPREQEQQGHAGGGLPAAREKLVRLDVPVEDIKPGALRDALHRECIEREDRAVHSQREGRHHLLHEGGRGKRAEHEEARKERLQERTPPLDIYEPRQERDER
mmetsp:Transcript_24791/g.62743  ORF Transcript_24791/g.62743 Transcript_24791/m.62743 type:complete len:239 (-) Transcript_24791:459-1175(-)